jgi:hypothetical protein
MRGPFIRLSFDTISDTNESKEKQRKKECAQKQGTGIAYEYVKACQQHACNKND